MATKKEVIEEKAVTTPEMVEKAIAGDIPTPTFSKSQIVKSNKYRIRHDALDALLKEDGQYTHAQVDALLKKFYEGGK